MSLFAATLIVGCDDENGGCGSDMPNAHARMRAMRAVKCDSQAIMSHIDSAAIAPTEADALQTRTRDLAHLASAALSSAAFVSARLPLTTEHQQMYELAAQAERASGSAALLTWATNPWAPLDPLERPAERSEQKLSTALMRGERRALALNVRNTAAEPREITLEVRLAELPEQSIRVHKVNWTGNDRSDWIAAELEPLESRDGTSKLRLLPGITHQIWIQLYADAWTAPGLYSGAVRLETADTGSVEIPIELQVFARALPEQLTTHFGGWDYADGSSNYAVTSANRAQLVKQLQASYVDTPWAQRAVLHWDNIGPNGAAVGPPDASALAQWLAQWPSARRFRVFLSVEDSIGTIPANDARFASAVGVWARGWAEEIRRLGRSASDFDLLLVDEPRTPQEVRTTVAWARAIATSGVGFRIWTDPVSRDPSSTSQELIAAADTISINLGAAEQAGQAYWDWARGLTRQGKRVEIYACDGPSRRLDPYAYYRLMAWRAFSIGASGVSFWSFVDTPNAGADGEFSAITTNYSPLFITHDRVRSGKHMEAAVEGLQDVEYLVMLREVATTSARRDVRERASDLLDGAVSAVLGPIRSSNAQWSAQVENSAAEQRRREIGEFLDSLRE